MREKTRLHPGGLLVAIGLALFILHRFELPWVANSSSCSAVHVSQHSISSTQISWKEETGTIECDVSRYRYNICFITGPVRVDPTAGTVLLLFSNNNASSQASLPLKFRPHPRKWENQLMRKIKELTITITSKPPTTSCDFYHDKAAIIFSTGGYTGNIYHDVNDGILPLFLTSQLINQSASALALVVSEYHDWWARKYQELLIHLSIHPPINLDSATSAHCFRRGAIVGLVSHGDLTIDPSRVPRGEDILHFRSFLNSAYSKKSNIRNLPPKSRRPILVMVIRNKSRCITNQVNVTALAEEMGFEVKIFQPTQATDLNQAYRLINTSHAMMGVHGAGLTHFLFLRPGSAFVQVIPLGTDWAAETCYGGPAQLMGLTYIPYRVEVKESSLVDKYGTNDVVLRDPDSVVKQSWMNTKNIYLGPQNVTLDLERLRPYLKLAYQHARRFMEDTHRNQTRFSTIN